MSDDRSELIRRAFVDSIAVLGERSARALIEDLQRHDVHMDSLTLEKLAVGLRHMLGDEATEIIMQEVVLRLDKMESSRTS